MSVWHQSKQHLPPLKTKVILFNIGHECVEMIPYIAQYPVFRIAKHTSHYSLTDVFIGTPSRLLQEEFSHAAINVHTIPKQISSPQPGTHSDS